MHGICSRATGLVAIVIGLGLTATAPAQDEPGGTGIQRPKYQFLRFNEDWSVLRDATEAQKTDFWDPIKYVPLSQDGDIWASFGGHMRFRLENWSDFAFGAPADPDDTFLLWRLTLHADVHFGENVRAFVEGKSALSTDRDLPGGKRTLDVDALDLEQAFVDIRFPFADDASLTVRPGRQTFLFGKQRLVSPLPWANTLRRWDGVSAVLNLHGWNVTGFWSQFVPVEKYDFNDPEDDIEFYGVYATGRIGDTGIGLDLYYLGLDRDGVAFNGTAGDEDRHTLGGRLFGKCGDSGFDYDFEAAYQFGEVGSGDVDAFMIGSEFGYKFRDTWADPRLFLGFDYATGDNTPGGDVETFNQLFPLGHAYLGYMDFIGRQNIVDLSAGATLAPMPKLNVGIAGHLFWREDTSDALYNAGGGIVRAGALGDDREVGSEIDLTVKYAFDRHLHALLGYSHFFAGDFIDESGSDDDMDFFYAQLQYTF